MASLIFASNGLVLFGRAFPKLPAMVDSKGRLMAIPTDWFRWMAVSGQYSIGSIRHYAKQLCTFFEFLNDLPLSSIDQDVMCRWRGSFNASNNWINDNISTVFRFLVWCEAEGHISGVIGEPAKGSWPPAIPITLRKDKFGRRVISSNLFLRRAKSLPKHTPNADELKRFYAVLTDQKYEIFNVASRDALIASWAQQTGLRRAEILSLNTSVVPAEADLICAADEGKDYFNLVVVGKRGKKREIIVPTSLFLDTRKYINRTRSKIIAKTTPPVNDNIFISHTTGKRLSLDYITRRMSSAFKASGVKGSLHRIRAYYLTQLVEKCIDDQLEIVGNINAVSIDTVLLLAADRAGHENVETLRSYLLVDLKRRVQASPSKKLASPSEPLLKLNEVAQLDVAIARKDRAEVRRLSKLIAATFG